MLRNELQYLSKGNKWLLKKLRCEEENNMGNSPPE